MSKKGLFSRIIKSIDEFFEDDEKENSDEKISSEEKISVKTLVIILILGLVIIIALYLFNPHNKLKNVPGTEIDNDINIEQSLTNKILINESIIKGNHTCFSRINVTKNVIVNGLYTDSKHPNEFGISVYGELEISSNSLNALNKNLKNINLVSMKLKSDENQTVSFSVGDGTNFSKERYFKVDKSDDWETININTSEEFKENDYFISFKNQKPLYFSEIILCE